MLVNIADIEKKCKVLGPGIRYVIWVQGCLKRCKGCYNTEYQPLIENKLMDTKEIINDIIKYKEKNLLEGVTFLGGEPLLQAIQLKEIAKAVKKNNMTILCYTGYSYEEIKNEKEVSELLEYVDVLIDGDFQKEKKVNQGYRGSSNQNIIFLTDKYKKEDFDVSNSYEITIKNSSIKIKGFYK